MRNVSAIFVNKYLIFSGHVIPTRVTIMISCVKK